MVNPNRPPVTSGNVHTYFEYSEDTLARVRSTEFAWVDRDHEGNWDVFADLWTNGHYVGTLQRYREGGALIMSDVFVPSHELGGDSAKLTPEPIRYEKAIDLLIKFAGA